MLFVDVKFGDFAEVQCYKRPYFQQVLGFQQGIHENINTCVQILESNNNLEEMQNQSENQPLFKLLNKSTQQFYKQINIYAKNQKMFEIDFHSLVKSQRHAIKVLLIKNLKQQISEQNKALLNTLIEITKRQSISQIIPQEIIEQNNQQQLQEINQQIQNNVHVEEQQKDSNEKRLNNCHKKFCQFSKEIRSLKFKQVAKILATYLLPSIAAFIDYMLQKQGVCTGRVALFLNCAFGFLALLLVLIYCAPNKWFNQKDS